MTGDEVEQKISRLRLVVNDPEQDENMRAVMHELVPTYLEADEVNACADDPAQKSITQAGSLQKPEAAGIPK